MSGAPEGEVWRPVPGWEDHFEVSNLGRVKELAWQDQRGRHQVPRITDGATGGGGYRAFNRRRGDRELRTTVHALVLEAFVGPRPAGMEACHGNGDRTDNRLVNLRWDTSLANSADRSRHEAERQKAQNAVLARQSVADVFEGQLRERPDAGAKGERVFVRVTSPPANAIPQSLVGYRRVGHTSRGTSHSECFEKLKAFQRWPVVTPEEAGVEARSLGVVLRELRGNLSVSVVASSAGVASTTIRRMESLDSYNVSLFPSLLQFWRLVTFYGATPDQVMELGRIICASKDGTP